MEIRPGVLEKASKKKKERICEKCSKNNNKVFHWKTENLNNNKGKETDK